MEQLKEFYEDYPAWFASCVMIEDFDEDYNVPLVMNEAQSILHEVAEKQLRETGEVRIQVLKARRMGMSTYVEARGFHHAMGRENFHVHVSTHKTKSTHTIFSMAKKMWEFYPEELKMRMETLNKNEMSWEIGSKYSVSTAGETAGRDSGGSARGSKKKKKR